MSARRPGAPVRLPWLGPGPCSSREGVVLPRREGCGQGAGRLWTGVVQKAQYAVPTLLPVLQASRRDSLCPCFNGAVTGSPQTCGLFVMQARKRICLTAFFASKMLRLRPSPRPCDIQGRSMLVLRPVRSNGKRNVERKPALVLGIPPSSVHAVALIAAAVRGFSSNLGHGMRRCWRTKRMLIPKPTQTSGTRAG